MEENQQIIGGDFTVKKQQGFIRNLDATEREGKDPMYKFQIRYIDNKDKLQEPNDWYSGFKCPPARNGDYIIFTYKVNDIYNNIKDILDVKLTHEDPTEKDVEDVQKIQIDNENPELKSDYEGENVTVANVIDRKDLDKPYRALLLNGTIHLCSKRGALTEADIIAQYNRFLSIL